MGRMAVCNQARVRCKAKPLRSGVAQTHPNFPVSGGLFWKVILGPLLMGSDLSLRLSSVPFFYCMLAVKLLASLEQINTWGSLRTRANLSLQPPVQENVGRRIGSLNFLFLKEAHTWTLSRLRVDVSIRSPVSCHKQFFVRQACSIMKVPMLRHTKLSRKGWDISRFFVGGRGGEVVVGHSFEPNNKSDLQSVNPS